MNREVELCAEEPTINSVCTFSFLCASAPNCVALSLSHQQQEQ